MSFIKRNKFKIAVFAVILLIVPIGAFVKRDDIGSFYFEKGSEHFKKKEYGKAAKNYKRAMIFTTSSWSDAAATYNMSICFYELEEYDKALKYNREAQKKHIWPLNYTGIELRVYDRQKDYDQMFFVADSLYNLYSDHVPTMVWRSYALFQRGDYQSALDGFNHVLQYGTMALGFSDTFSEDDVKYWKCYCLNRLGRYQESIQCADNALISWNTDGSRRAELLYQRGAAKIALNDLAGGCQDVRTSYYEEGLQEDYVFRVIRDYCQ